MERITNLSAPPVVGRIYLVPTIEWEVCSLTRHWPVYLPLHEDGRFFAFKDVHYHVDPRFVGSRDWVSVQAWKRSLGDDTPDCRALAALQAQPVGTHRSGRWKKDPPDQVIWRRMTAKRSAAPYQFGWHDAVAGLRNHYTGQQCSRARTGWVCPHQHWPMGSVAPDEHGVITCPLHGLQIDNATGLVLGAQADRCAA